MPRGSRWGPRGLGHYLRPNRVAPAVFPKQAQIPFPFFGMAEPESLVPGESYPESYPKSWWLAWREGPLAGGRPGPASGPALWWYRPQPEPESMALDLRLEINNLWRTRGRDRDRGTLCVLLPSFSCLFLEAAAVIIVALSIPGSLNT